MQIRAYRCYIKHDWSVGDGRVYNTTSAGKAKSLYLQHCRDPLPELEYTDIAVQSLGKVVSTKDFEHIKGYRRVSNAEIGMTVTVLAGYGKKREAVLVDGGGGGAYFEVIFKDDQSRCWVHPAEIEEFKDEMYENEKKYEQWLASIGAG